MSTPKKLFDDAWSRCQTLSGIHLHLSNNTTNALDKDEILRCEWVSRVSALDLYVHELVVQKMVMVFEGKLPVTPAYQKFKIPNEIMHRIVTAPVPVAATSAFEFEIRRQLGFLTYQSPDAIADGIRHFSTIELWNAVAISRGMTGSNISKEAKAIKTQLSLIVDRRNKIAHEGDMGPLLPRIPWPISVNDVRLVSVFIGSLVSDFDRLLN